MTAIHTGAPALTIRAGRRALQRLKDKPLTPDDVHVIPGAAGGPKALGISGLDKAIFGDWLPRVTQERSLIGSSIGSWRFAAVASSDNPRAQLAKLADLYTCQRFAKGVSAAEVSRKSVLFLETLLGGREEDILNHPWYRLNVVVVRSRGMLEHDSRGRLSLGLMRAISANMVSRRHLGRFMERGIIHDVRLKTPVSRLIDFPSHEVALSRDNLLPALLASASIPMIMSGVRDIPGAPTVSTGTGGCWTITWICPMSSLGSCSIPTSRTKWCRAGSTSPCPGAGAMSRGCRMFCWLRRPGNTWPRFRTGNSRIARTLSTTWATMPVANGPGVGRSPKATGWGMSFWNCWKPGASPTLSGHSEAGARRCRNRNRSASGSAVWHSRQGLGAETEAGKPVNRILKGPDPKDNRNLVLVVPML